MKFEQLLRIYWSRKFLYEGKTFNFDVNWNEFWKNITGTSNFTKKNFIKRFEFHNEIPRVKGTKTNYLVKNSYFTKTIYPVDARDFLFSKLKLDYRKVINMYLGKLASVRNNVSELLKYNIIKLYLIKSFRGRAQAMGKPSRGQKTRSNGWSAFKNNFVIKNFLEYVTKLKKTHERVEKIDYKKLKIKKKKSSSRLKPKFSKKSLLQDLWF
jgi:hypothetical protein